MKFKPSQLGILCTLLFASFLFAPSITTKADDGKLRFCKCNGKCKGKGGCCDPKAQLDASDELC